MSNETTENFWKAWNQPLPEPWPLFYRLYYNDQGHPICYSMEDLPGTYIEIDQQTYAQGSLHVRVINNKIHDVSACPTVSKLRPDVQGTACHPNNVCVIVDPEHPHTFWNMHTYDAN